MTVIFYICTSLGVSNMLTKMNEESKDHLADEDYAIPPPSPMAIDYSNISDNEAIEDEPSSSFSKQNNGNINFILPSLLPGSSTAANRSTKEENKDESKEDKEKEEKKKERRRKQKEYTEQDILYKGTNIF